MAAKKQFKITYSTLGADMEKFHREFDRALDKVREHFGESHPHYINNQAVAGAGQTFASKSPVDTRVDLAYFREGTSDEVDAAVRAAKEAFPKWAATDYQKRAKIIQKAAALIRKDKFTLAAIMAFEVGKNRLESMGDVEESADLLDYYAKQLLDAKGFVKPLAKLNPKEDTRSVLRPYGVWAMIAPFNFPLALPTGMSAGVLLGGNTLVYKSSVDTPWITGRLAEIYIAAGMPPGVVNFVAGDRHMGNILISHPLLNGIVFTGSKAVGMKIFQEFNRDYIKPVILELGGKNPAIVMPSADLDIASDGVMKSAFGLQGQKCSACSRVYVHKKVKDKFLELLLRKTAGIKIGDPVERDVFMGPVVNQKAYDKFAAAVEEARRDGTILTGGRQLREGDFANGYFVEPTIVDHLPRDHRIFKEELFLPFLAVGEIESLEEGVQLSNNVEYGLTAGIYTKNKKELDYFFDNIEAGVTYANRRSGATTGAWPGVNSFCGWKGSGGSGKGGCGPYYVQQFMREQSRTIQK